MLEWIASWNLTYLFHSTILLGSAWFLVRVLPQRTLSAQDVIWKTALVGGVITATLQVGLLQEQGLRPWMGSWQLLPRPAQESSEAISRPAISLEKTASRVSASRNELVATATTDSKSFGSFSASPTKVRAAMPATRHPRPVDLFVAAWALGASALLMALGLAWLDLGRRLSSRRFLRGGSLGVFLDRLSERAPRARPVGLAASPRIDIPIAWGLRRREICLPERIVREMPSERQELVIAHEMAHHQRRDPAWLLTARVLESVFFFQPLNRMARHRLQEIAEYLCDDWAVEQTGRPISLARCLTEVAEWRLAARGPLVAPTLAAERRRLGRRVKRLLERAYPLPSVPSPRWLGGVLLGVLVLMILAAPGVSNGAADAGKAAREEVVARAESTAARGEELNTHPPEVGAGAAVSAPVSPAPTTHPRMEISPEPVVRPAPLVAPRPAALARISAAALVAPVSVAEVSTPPAPPPPPPAPEALETFEPSDPNAGWKILEDWDARLLETVEILLEDLDVEIEPLRLVLEENFTPLALSIKTVDGFHPSPELLERIEAKARELEEAMEIDPEALARIEEVSARLAAMAELSPEVERRIEELSREIAERSQPELSGLEALSEELAEKSRPDAEAIARLETVAQRLEENGRLTAEEREALRAEARRIAEAVQPNADELRLLREQIQREVEASRPDREELRRLHEEIRREIELNLPNVEEMRRLREELHIELKEQIERKREVAGSLREELGELERELRREVESIEREEIERRRQEASEVSRLERAELDRLRAEAKQLRAEVEELRREAAEASESGDFDTP